MKKLPRTYLSAAIVSLMALAAYLPAVRNQFLNWDDDIYVYANYGIRSLNITFLKDYVFGFYESYWIPLTWLSHALDYALWGLNPGGHHLSSILLHALNTFLVVCLTARLCEAAGPAPCPQEEGGGLEAVPGGLQRRRTLVICLVTGVLFGLHPLRVESVAWVSERKDVLYAFFSLLSLLAYAGYVRSRDGDRAEPGLLRPIRNRHYAFSLAWFACALASKPMAVTLPVILLILDWYPFRRMPTLKSAAPLFREKAPFMAGSLVISLVAIISHRASRDMPALADISVHARLANAFHSSIQYLWKTIAPFDLVPMYAYPAPGSVSLFSAKYALPALLVAAITASCLATFRKSRVWAALWLYYLVTLLPVVGLVQTGSQAMADRFTYLSGLGPFLAVGIASAEAWCRKGVVLRRAALVLGLLIFVGMAYLTVRQIAVWNNNIDFWDYVIAKEPQRFPLAYTHRGIALHEQGQTELALADFERAISLDASRSTEYLARTNRARVYRAQGDFAQALEDLNIAIGLNPLHGDAFTNRGMIMQEAGRHDLAIADFSRAIALEPSAYEAYVLRGISLRESGQFEQAISDYNAAIGKNPTGAEAYNNRGVVFRQQGRADHALADYSRAIALNPSFYLAYCNRGVALRAMGRIKEALEDLTKAISLRPDLMRGYLDRADTYRATGDMARAKEDYETACRLGLPEACEAARTYAR